MMNSQTINHLMLVKARYEKELLKKEHVVGIGLGVRTENRVHGDEACIVVMVDRLVPMTEQSPEDRIPSELEGVPVDIQEVGELYAS